QRRTQKTVVKEAFRGSLQTEANRQIQMKKLLVWSSRSRHGFDRGIRRRFHAAIRRAGARRARAAANLDSCHLRADKYHKRRLGRRISVNPALGLDAIRICLAEFLI